MTRAKGKSHWRKFQGGVLVLCKCPYCGEKHLVKFESAPIVMPRIYCPPHEYMRVSEPGEYDYGQQTRRRATA